MLRIYQEGFINIFFQFSVFYNLHKLKTLHQKHQTECPFNIKQLIMINRYTV